jgi:hypothetical protein
MADQGADIDQLAFEAIADRLYQLRPDAFAAARDEAVRQARADKNPALARALGELRRPTQGAWLVNLLWRDQRNTIEGLLELAENLQQAQAQTVGRDLQRLMDARRELETALVRRAGHLAEAAGVKITTTLEREVQGTLAAALADRAVADELRTGRMVKPASYAGFGTFGMASDIGDAAATPTVSVRPEGAAASAPPESARAGDEERRLQAERDAEAAAAEAAVARAEAERREQDAQRAREAREQAAQRVIKARSVLDAAATTLAARVEAAAVASQQQESLRLQAEDLRQQLQALERELAEAERASLQAAHGRDQAEGEHERAQRELTQAEDELKALP